MEAINRNFPGQSLLGGGRASTTQILLTGGWLRRYRLTIFFAITAIMLITAAAILVNIVVGNLAEDNLVRIAEENTARDGLHIQSMMRMGHSMGGVSSSDTVHSGTAMKDMGQPVAGGMPPGAAVVGTKNMEEMRAAMSRGMSPSEAGDSANTMDDMQMSGQLTLESLVGPGGLPMTYQSLVDGLNILQFDLQDPNGTVVWSTNPKTIGLIKLDTVERREAVGGEISSRLTKDFEVVDEFGVSYHADVVATVLPLRETPSGEIIGLIEIYRGVAHDVAFQVDDAKSVVLWTTIGAMGGLFVFLFGFILIADSTIHRSRRRELAVVEEANSTLESRVQERTQQLEDAQEQLVRSEKLSAIGQLAGGVAHDIRSPLGAIKAAVYYLRRKLAPTDMVAANPRIGEFLQIAEDSVEHANQILNDLMSFARVGAGSLVPTNLEDIVKNALSTMELREDVQIIEDFAPDLPEVIADGEQLYRVFINLVNNAQDAMADGGQLTISTRFVDGHGEVAFRDTGIGISDEDMKKIFEPPFTTKTKGTGLGLSVCQQIVAKHGGSMEVSSTHGEGSTFMVRLPIAPEQA